MPNCCATAPQGTAVALGTYHTVALLTSQGGGEPAGPGPAEYGLYTTGRGESVGRCRRCWPFTSPCNLQRPAIYSAASRAAERARCAQAIRRRLP